MPRKRKRSPSSRRSNPIRKGSSRTHRGPKTKPRAKRSKPSSRQAKPSPTPKRKLRRGAAARERAAARRRPAAIATARPAIRCARACERRPGGVLAMSRARDRLAFPLDYATLDEARKGAALVAESVGVLKVGLELFVREGVPAARIGSDFDCQVFLDLKLHDIPETVERAVASACSFGVRYLTLHASGGPKMLERAARRAEAENPELVLLAVTVLTSLDASDLSAIGAPGEPAAQALRLGRLA